jgi:hypothetical protein
MLSGGDFNSLLNFGKSSYVYVESDATKRVKNEFYTIDNDCVTLDATIKKLTDKIASETSKSKLDKAYILALEEYKMLKERDFTYNNCSQKIEKVKQIESAILITKEAIKSEESIISKNNIEQKIYIGAGSLILLVGLYIIVKK